MTDGPYRTPGKPPELPPNLWRCPKCEAVYHVLANARRVGDQIICMTCYAKLLQPTTP